MFGPVYEANPRKCPHENIKDCPLYVVSHDSSGRGCVKDLMVECDVTLGKMDYWKEVERLRRGDA